MSELLLINPRKRRRRKSSAKRRTRARARPVRRRKRRSMIAAFANPAKRSRKRRRRSIHRSIARFRRNPSSRGGKFSIKGTVKDTLIPSAIGAAGALGLDVLLGLVPLPDMLKTPTVRPFVRIAGAIGIGMLASMVAGRKIGEQVTAGAVTVTVYDIMKGVVQQAMPTLSLGDVGYYPSLEYVGAGLNAGDSVNSMTQPYNAELGMYMDR